MERFDKALSANTFYKIPLDVARANREVAKEIGHLSVPPNWYRRRPEGLRIAISSALFLGNAAYIAVMPEEQAVTHPESIALSIAAAALTGHAAHKLQQRKAKKEILKATRGQGEMLEALLNADNSERLNDMMFEQAGRKTKEKKTRMALAATVFAAIKALSAYA